MRVGLWAARVGLMVIPISPSSLAFQVPAPPRRPAQPPAAPPSQAANTGANIPRARVPFPAPLRAYAWARRRSMEAAPARAGTGTLEDIRRRFSQDENLYPPGMIAETNMTLDSKYGPPKQVPVGKCWDTRLESSEAGVHKPTMAGISGCKDGAFSIVMSGAYEDCSDDGETFVYIGTGGKADSGFGSTGPQVADQSMEHSQNKFLVKSLASGRHVRVIRGPDKANPWAPLNGYRYDGLYTVTQAWEDKGRSGFKVCKFRFVRNPGQPRLVQRRDMAPKRAKKTK